MGLPLVMTELQSIKVVLRHLHPDSVDIAPMAGLLSLGLVVQTLEQRLAAVKDLVGGGERARQHRRTELPATTEVLTNNELLASILSYAGAGEFLFIAPVSKRDESWPARYINALCNAAAQWGRTSTLDFLLARGQQLFGALGTASLDDDEVRRASWALMCFDVEGTEHVRTLTDAAATAYSVAVLQWLQSRHALEFTGMTMLMAASNAALPNMKWLQAQGCPHDINEVCIMLMRVGGTEPLLDWVQSCGGGDWSPQGMARLLRSALSNDTPGLPRWLRAEGARWPEDLAEVVTTEIEEVKPSMILWAVQQGCPFGRWTTEVCDSLVRSHPDGAAVKRTLHDLGCPCACPRPYKL
ncbi:hypothetical protein JKP88DRAFT_349795 [Tribonema minus]|uniref:Ankyrin repeat protein n=1 Tax=Tribonema minus TaxID=303371 RepID=A0A835YSQ3_9STRA|nr:hypothetical protein JKP88DRAFT_349795 [Tribonema minus]